LQRLESRLRDLKSPEWPFCRNDQGEYYLPEPQKDVPPSHPKYCPGNDKRFNEEQRYQGELIYIDRCHPATRSWTGRPGQDYHRPHVRRRQDRHDPAMAENSVKHNGKSGNFKDTYQGLTWTCHRHGRRAGRTNPHGCDQRRHRHAGRDKWWPQRMVDGSTPGHVLCGQHDQRERQERGLQPERPRNLCQPPRIQGRSLNGIWATAPYLHNGSVPTLWDLLLPASQRPKSFKVGAREFDPDKVGFKSAGYDGTQFNTDLQRGNYNTGTKSIAPSASTPDKAAAKHSR